jgi:hypothetical protein
MQVMQRAHLFKFNFAEKPSHVKTTNMAVLNLVRIWPLDSVPEFVEQYKR